MFVSNLVDLDGSQCTLTYEEQWLRATWKGFVDPTEAQRGAENYLAHAATFRCPALLNDNAALVGPWFDSVDWLAQTWLPLAQQVGLRYAAHVVQADTHFDILTLTLPKHLQVDLQIFQQVAEAEQWLRSCLRP